MLLPSLRRQRSAIAGLSIVGLLVLLALAGAALSPHDPQTWRPGQQAQAPSVSHWLGTDHAGRDILTRLFYGGRISLLIGAACMLFSASVGIPLGACAGYSGGRLDSLFSRLIDVLLSFPGVLLAIAIAAPMGAGLGTVVVAVGVVGIPSFFRQTRAAVLELRDRDFVVAARALGTTPARILFRHILPNASGPLIVVATLGIGSAILTAAGLSFIGLGVEAGTPEWGAMLHDGYEAPELRRTLALSSGLAISLAVLGFNLFGDALRDAMDPRTRR